MASSRDPPTEPVNILKAFCEAKPVHAQNVSGIIIPVKTN